MTASKPGPSPSAANVPQGVFYGLAGFCPAAADSTADDTRPESAGPESIASGAVAPESTSDAPEAATSAAFSVSRETATAHVVHLSEGSVLLVRDGASTLGWRERFRARLRTCGPWNEEQVRDYFLLTYGGEPDLWPIPLAAIARAFHDSDPDRGVAIAREVPEVYAFLTCATPLA